MAKNRIPGWLWPVGLAVAGLGSAAAVLLRGCWHRHVSWPIRYDEHFSYVVCTDCGVKRLFDENLFHEYGPYGYEIEELIAHERARHIERIRRHEAMISETVRRVGSPKPEPDGADTEHGGGI